MGIAAPVIDCEQRCRDAQGRAAAAIALRELVEGENLRLQDWVGRLSTETVTQRARADRAERELARLQVTRLGEAAVAVRHGVAVIEQIVPKEP